MIGRCLCDKSAATVWRASVDSDCFLERAVVGRPIVGIVGGCAANNSLYDVCTRFKIVRNSFYGNVVVVLLNRRASAGASVFGHGVMGVGALNRCPEHQCLQCVHYTDVVDITVHVCDHTWYRVCTCARFNEYFHMLCKKIHMLSKKFVYVV